MGGFPYPIITKENGGIQIPTLLVTRLAQTVAGWQAACEDRQNF